MKFNACNTAMGLGLVLSLGACGPKLQTVADNKTDSSTTEPDSNRRETVTVGVNVAEKNAGFRLATATSYNMSLVGCASGLTVASITQSNPNVDVYKFDQGCLIQLNSFVLNGITYAPSVGDPFTSWALGDIATFEQSGVPTNNFTVVVGSQLNNPITGTEAVSYTFTQLAKGTDESIAKSVVGDSHALSVSGQDAPTLDIKGVTMTGMTAQGAGQFTFRLECDSALTGVSPNFICGTTGLTSMKYRLVADTYGSVLTAAQAAAIFTGTEPTIAAGDLFANAGPVNGGFNTQTLTGPDAMHTNSNMLFLVQAAGSYKYFNVDVSTLTYP